MTKQIEMTKQKQGVSPFGYVLLLAGILMLVFLVVVIATQTGADDECRSETVVTTFEDWGISCTVSTDSGFTEEFFYGAYYTVDSCPFDEGDVVNVCVANKDSILKTRKYFEGYRDI